jgi:hypothetical protein
MVLKNIISHRQGILSPGTSLFVPDDNKCPLSLKPRKFMADCGFAGIDSKNRIPIIVNEKMSIFVVNALLHLHIGMNGVM